MAPTAQPTLTAYSFFTMSTVDELKQQGRTKVPPAELADRWRSLSDAARKPFDEKAAAAQDAYLKELTQKQLERLESLEGGDDDGEENEGEENEENEENEAEEANEEEDAADDIYGRTSAKAVLPICRVKRMAQDHIESCAGIGKEATFVTSKAAEVFLERCMWGAVRYMQKQDRKSIKPVDLVAALKLHPSPEVMQFFVEELAPAPPPPPPKPAKDDKKKKPKKKNVKATPKIVWEDAVGAEQKKASTSSKRKRAEEPAAVAAEPAASVPVAAGGEARHRQR